MLKTNEVAESSNVFLIGGRWDGVIGYDGLGAIEIDQVVGRSELASKDWTPFELVEARPGTHLDPEARLAGDVHDVSLNMRRGVRPFDMLYRDTLNYLLLSEKIDPKIKDNVLECLDRAASVLCRFGKTREGRYIFGNLRWFDVIGAHVNWARSEFCLVDASDFHMYQTRVERGKIDFSVEPAYVQSGLRFEDYGAFRKLTSDSWPCRLIPSKLSVSGIPEVAILNLNFRTTLFREDIVAYLKNSKRPGVIFSLPRVIVEFLA